MVVSTFSASILVDTLIVGLGRVHVLGVNIEAFPYSNKRFNFGRHGIPKGLADLPSSGLGPLNHLESPEFELKSKRQFISVYCTSRRV